MRESDPSQSSLGKKLAVTKSGWLADATDIFILLGSFLLITASIVLVALIFDTQGLTLSINDIFVHQSPVPKGIVVILQRMISALSVTVTSAVIMVAEKRHVLFKLAREGIPRQRVAVYSHPSVGSLAKYLPTGLTVNDAWAMVPNVEPMNLGIAFGPFNDAAYSDSLFLRASGQLSFVMASLCSKVGGTVGLINMRSTQDLSRTVFYPPLPYYPSNSAFSLSTIMNGFNISVEPLSVVPTAAQSLTCVGDPGHGFNTGQLWYEGGDNQTLSTIGLVPSFQSLYRFNASAIVLGGTLRSTGNQTVFTPNGTMWPNVMYSNRWAQDIASLVCNTTVPTSCTMSGSPEDFLDFSMWLTGCNYADEGCWDIALSMAMGAYSVASWPNIGTSVLVPVTRNSVLNFTPRRGAYVLIANIVVSAIMLFLVVTLRLASRLGADFLNSTRLLLDPLKTPGLFNAPLDATVSARANPWMMVREESEFMLVDGPSSEKMSWTIA